VAAAGAAASLPSRGLAALFAGIRRRRLGGLLLAWTAVLGTGVLLWRQAQNAGFLYELLLPVEGALLVWALREALLHLTPRSGHDRRGTDRRTGPRRR
jgi:glucose dehydrogenase